jgi:hypothetical protein
MSPPWTPRRAREPYLGRLSSLIAECDRRGMAVDVTLSRGNGVTGPARLATIAAHQRAVETLVGFLKPHRNWYLDLGNERNIRDARFVSFDELRRLRDAAKRLDARRLITASHAGGELSREDVAYLSEVQVDFLSPHRRGIAMPQRKPNASREGLTWPHETGRGSLALPGAFPARLRRWQPSADDFATDLAGARAGGAAGWCFHNGDARGRPEGESRRSFDLRERRLFDQFDAEERAFLARLLRE